MKLVQRFLLSASFFLFSVAGAQPNAPFTFVAIGDLPYGDAAEVYPPYERLIGIINRAQPDFTVHVGDIKSGSTECSDEELANQKAFFNSFATALVYTPGDNEWTDCHRESAGEYDPLERLAKVRELFFPSALTLGQQPFRVERQADVMPRFGLYVENSRFVHRGVLFVQAHIVGSNNNFEPRNLAAVEEFLARDAANVAWLTEAFRLAEREAVRGVVISVHADVFDSAAPYGDFPRHSGFAETFGNTLLPAAEALNKPVLVIHGDSHVFKLDRPYTNEEGDVIPNVTRLEVFGDTDMDAVQVTVSPDAPNGSLFSFAPLYGPDWGRVAEGE